jgi:hypothetical protein
MKSALWGVLGLIGALFIVTAMAPAMTTTFSGTQVEVVRVKHIHLSDSDAWKQLESVDWDKIPTDHFR